MSRSIRWSQGLAVVGFALIFWWPQTQAAQPVVEEAIEKTLSTEPRQEPAPPDVPIDDYGRGTPRGTVTGYRKAVERRDYERAANFLDLRRLQEQDREKRGSELARPIQVVAEPTMWIDLEAVSDDPNGYVNDGLPPYRDRLGRIETPDGKGVDFFLQRVPRGDGVFIWKVAAVTVARIPELYEIYGYGILDEMAPRFLLDVKVARAPLLEWAVLACAAVLALLLTYLLTLIALRILRKWKSKASPYMAELLAGPFRLLLWLPVFWLITESFSFSISPRIVLHAVNRALLAVAVAWMALRTIDVICEMLLERLDRTVQTGAVSLLSSGRKAAKVLVILLAVIAALQSFGFNITALVAGLGIGGLAAALAAQKTLENFIAGITLYADRPVTVGEFCRVGDMLGTVEEIGLRSTRVRTLGRTVLSIPNADFANLQVDNLSKRDKILYKPRVSLRCETTPDQLRYVLVEVRRMLYAHPMVDPVPARIRFSGFGAYSLDLDVFAYVTTAEYDTYLEVVEDLNLRIMDIISSAGTSVAVPSQTTYVEKSAGMDGEVAAKVSATVGRWRQEEELYIPRFPAEKIRELRGSLEYPSQGSPKSGRELPVE